MPYNRIAGTPKAIEFYYLVSDLLSEGSLESQYALIVGEGFPEDLILTGDEADFMGILLQDAANTILSGFLPYSNGLTNTFVVNANYTPSGGNQGVYVAVKIIDHANFEPGYLDLVDSSARRCLVTSVLAGWLSRRGVEDKAAQIANYLVTNLREFLAAAEFLKKPDFELGT